MRKTGGDVTPAKMSTSRQASKKQMLMPLYGLVVGLATVLNFLI